MAVAESVPAAAAAAAALCGACTLSVSLSPFLSLSSPKSETCEVYPASAVTRHGTLCGSRLYRRESKIASSAEYVAFLLANWYLRLPGWVMAYALGTMTSNTVPETFYGSRCDARGRGWW